MLCSAWWQASSILYALLVYCEPESLWFNSRSPGFLNSYASLRAFMHSPFLMLPSETVHYRRNIQFSVFARSLRYVRKPFLVRCICAKVSFQNIFLPQRLFIRLGKTVRTPSALMQADISKTLPDFRDVLRVWSVSLCVKMTYALNIATNIKEHCPDYCRARNFYTSRLLC